MSHDITTNTICSHTGMNTIPIHLATNVLLSHGEVSASCYKYAMTYAFLVSQGIRMTMMLLYTLLHGLKAEYMYGILSFVLAPLKTNAM